MSSALLDVSVLIALFDRGHVKSDRVAGWFADNASSGWSSCPITENGFVRIVSQPTYPNLIQARQAVEVLATATASRFHEFWPCDLSITAPGVVRPDRILRSSQLTDVYLLALAVRHHGCFVTLDQHIDLDLVTGATADNLIVID